MFSLCREYNIHTVHVHCTCIHIVIATLIPLHSFMCKCMYCCNLEHDLTFVFDNQEGNSTVNPT